MLNFISPYATRYTREKHEGKKNPQIEMWNRKPYRTAAQKRPPRRSGEDKRQRATRRAGWIGER